ncbi:MAG: antibiotic biosynthesis monooxygenase family protein [Dehalococcoidia bacterium]
MYARVTTFKLGPGRRQVAEELMRKIVPVIRSQKGFKQLYGLADDESGEYGGIVLWETKEDGEAAFKIVFPQVQQALQGQIAEPPKTGLYEVVEQ